MIKIRGMGRKKLNRVKRNLTMPAELASKADALAYAEGRALSAIVESLLMPYVEKNWSESMRLKPKEQNKPGPKSGLK